MVNPDHIRVVDGDGITTPDVLGVDISDSNVPMILLGGKFYQMHEIDILNDDVLGTADNAKTLTLDDTSGALTDKGLVGGDGHTQDTGVVAVGG